MVLHNISIINSHVNFGIILNKKAFFKKRKVKTNVKNKQPRI